MMMQAGRRWKLGHPSGCRCPLGEGLQVILLAAAALPGQGQEGSSTQGEMKSRSSLSSFILA